MSDQAAQVMPVVVELPAEIDVTNSSQVHDQLVAAMGSGVDVVIVDLTATSFCDSSGVHAIMSAHQAAVSRGLQLRIAISADGPVDRVLQLVGVSRVLPVYPSLSQALREA